MIGLGTAWRSIAHIMQLATCVGGAGHQRWNMMWHIGALERNVGGGRADTETRAVIEGVGQPWS